uniref:SMP domain-containing protein n=1 Tax=Oryza barthii TaxID=65489 RepID=A0A0D3GVD9_9ORYZ
MRATGLFTYPGSSPAMWLLRCSGHRGEHEAPPDEDGENINKATTLKDVVGSVAEVLPANKLATREDANKVAGAAAQNDEMSATGLFACPGSSSVVWLLRRSGCRGKHEAPPDDDGEKINKATTLKDVVMGGIAEVLPVNKLATRENANKVAAATAQNDGRHAGGSRELTRSIPSRSESIRNLIPHRVDAFFFSAGKAITDGRDKVHARTEARLSLDWIYEGNIDVTNRKLSI